ncbi:hypothetical protein QE152_g777 [Popillia japonica]|uniref:Uncharacterized protein n=1 Tax=Popillia japonica TaxID=7064 RepID=A0AAW1NE91_POPJA
MPKYYKEVIGERQMYRRIAHEMGEKLPLQPLLKNARAFIKCVKSHGGYSSCDKCTVEGKYVNNRVILDSTAAPKRTDESFLAQNDEEHHIGISPLESFLAQNDEEHHIGISPLLRLNIGMVVQKSIGHILKTSKVHQPVLKLKGSSEVDWSHFKDVEATLFSTFILQPVLKLKGSSEVDWSHFKDVEATLFSTFILRFLSTSTRC